MFSEWAEILSAAIQTLPPLYRDIVLRTMQIPGKRIRLSYSEAQKLWNLEPAEFDRQQNAAFDAVRLYLLRQGISVPDDLVLQELRQ